MTVLLFWNAAEERGASRGARNEFVVLQVGRVRGLYVGLWAPSSRLRVVECANLCSIAAASGPRRSSLYPALPVVLGLAVLHERVDRCQAVQLLGAAVTTELLALG